MTTIVRVPVLGVSAEDLHRPLACIDFDASGRRKGNECDAKFKAMRAGVNYLCPNLGKGCARGAFLYPRKNRGDGTFHYHQGLDVGAPRGTKIVSVIDGTVVDVGQHRERMSPVQVGPRPATRPRSDHVPNLPCPRIRNCSHAP